MTDLARLRTIADTRPGYTTHPDTPPGSPSWWRGQPPVRPVAPRSGPGAGFGWRPMPLDGRKARDGWIAYTSWRATAPIATHETCHVFDGWPTARRYALQAACLNGVRYVTVCDPDHVVHGEWDCYTNRWREYHHPGEGQFKP